jgi:hypothetical protein
MIGFVEMTRNCFICWILIADVEMTTKENTFYQSVLVGPIIDIYRRLKTFQDNTVSRKTINDISRQLKRAVISLHSTERRLKTFKDI